MFKFDEPMYGKKVRFVNAEAHEGMPDFYPPVGTIGTIMPVSYHPNGCFEEEDYIVEWPKGSTSWIDIWACGEESLELVEEDVDKS